MNTATDLLQHLIRIPSVNPDGGADGAISGEKKMADAVASFLSEACGASVTLEEVRPERPNVIGRFGGSSTETHDARPRLLFGPHTDTVGVKGMSIDPFSGDLRDGKIWGRGASDTKGSMAAMLWALREVSGEIDDLGCRPMFVGFMGEESNQYGSQHFAREHADEVDFALVGEPTELNAVHAHKACWWIRVSVGGVAVHGSKPELGENAILKMMSLLTQLEPALQKRLSTFADEVLGLPTVSVNQCEGGVRANVVPDHCSATLDIRATPSLFEKGVDRVVREELDHLGWGEADIEVIGKSPTLKTEANHPVIQKLNEIGSETTTAPWFCDAGWLAQAGIPGVAIGPGSIDQAHTEDEWIEVEALEEGAEFFTRFLRSF